MSIDIEQKKKALDAALLQIEKQYGKGAVMKLGDPSVQMNIETIPTGSLSLEDWAESLRAGSLRSTDPSPPVRLQ